MDERYIRTVMETSQPSDPQGVTDEEVVELWLRRQRSPLTRSVYRRDINRLLTVTRKSLPDHTPIDLERFAETLVDSGLAPISQGRTLAAIRSFYRFAEMIGHCRNVAAHLALPRCDQPVTERIVEEDVIQRMIQMEPDERNRALLTVLYTGGLRASEVCGLRWRHLQPRGKAGQLQIYGKGGRTRAVLLPEEVWCQLGALRGADGPDAPVFGSRSGKHLERSRILRIVKEAGKRAQAAAGIGTHWLRHAHASHALDRGAPLHLVQATLGHRSVATTGKYLHARPSTSSGEYLRIRQRHLQ